MVNWSSRKFLLFTNSGCREGECKLKLLIVIVFIFLKRSFFNTETLTRFFFPATKIFEVKLFLCRKKKQLFAILFVSVHFETLQGHSRELEAKTLFLNRNKQYAYAFFGAKRVNRKK